MNRDDFPPEIQQLLAGPADQPHGERLEAFGLAIAAKRKEAVDARKSSGIEDVWMYCEEAYLGIDDTNRAEFASAKWAKPTTMDGPLRKVSNNDGVKSTAFARLTSRYVDAGAAKIGEITLPIDEKPFNLTATPVPDLIDAKDDQRPLVDGGVPVMKPSPAQPAASGMVAPQPGQPAPPAQVPVTVADVAQHHLDEAADAAKKAEQRIYDWMIEYGHAAEMRKVLFDDARLGSGCLKGPFPEVSKAMAVTKTNGVVTLAIQQKIVPVARWVDIWNLFPDDSCGENIHNGSYILERDFLSRAKLSALKRQPNYIKSAIDKVLAEGPGKISVEGKNPGEIENRKRFEIWYFYGEITLEDLALTNPKEAIAVAETRTTIAKAKAKDGDEPESIDTSVFAIVSMVNDTVVRCVVNPLETGSFPYHVTNWRRRAGCWAGVGVAEQVKLPQEIINAATRAMLNNAGQSAGAITVADRSCLESPDGNWVMTPGKTLFKNSESSMDDVKKAFAFFTVPNATPQMLTIIDYAYKLAEESTNIPLISQGQSGDTTPDTFGAAQLQDNNANQLLRDVGFGVADDITNPFVTQMYEWLLLDEDVPANEKGDFKVNTNAAAAMIERAIQDQTIAQMGPLLANPALAIDPKKWFAAFSRSKRLDPREFQFSEDEQKKMEAQPPQPPLPLAVAQVRAQSAEKIAQGHDQVTMQRIKSDTDRDTAYNESLANRDTVNADAKHKDTEAKLRIADLVYQTALTEFANARGISTDRAKVELAKTAMQLRTQKELASNQHAHEAEQVASTEMEPAGRAPAGEAFQK